MYSTTGSSFNLATVYSASTVMYIDLYIYMYNTIGSSFNLSTVYSASTVMYIDLYIHV